MSRVCILLAALAILGTTAGPASAARSAEQLLINEAPAGFQLMPPQSGMTGPISLQQFAQETGMRLPAGVDSSSGFSRAWTDGTAGVAAFAMTFDDPNVAGGLLKGMTQDIREGADVQSLAGVEGGSVGTLTDPATNTVSEVAAFGRGNAVYFVIGSPGLRDRVVDIAARQSTLAGPGAPPTATSHYEASSLIGKYTARAVFAILLAAAAQWARRRLQRLRQQSPAAPNDAAPVPAGTWSIGPPGS